MEKTVTLESICDYSHPNLLSSLSAPATSSLSSSVMSSLPSTTSLKSSLTLSSTTSPIKRRNANNLRDCRNIVTFCCIKNVHKIITKFRISQKLSVLICSIAAQSISKWSMEIHVWRSCKSRQTGNKRTRHKLQGPLSLVLLVRFLLLWLMLLLSTTVEASPVYIDGQSLEPFQSGRNIRHIPCIVRKTGRSGVCMFAIDCIKQNGTHLGTCIDRFYFGSCCSFKDTATTKATRTTTMTTTTSTSTSTTTNYMPIISTSKSILTSEITDNSIDQNTISHYLNISNMILSHFNLQEKPTTDRVSTTENVLDFNNYTVNNYFSKKNSVLSLKNSTTFNANREKNDTQKIDTTLIATRRQPILHNSYKNSHFVVRTAPRPTMDYLKFTNVSTPSTQTIHLRHTTKATTKLPSIVTTSSNRLNAVTNNSIYNTTYKYTEFNTNTTSKTSPSISSLFSTMMVNASITSTTEKMDLKPISTTLNTVTGFTNSETTISRPVLISTTESKKTMTNIANSEKLFTFQIVETTTAAPVEVVETTTFLATTPIENYINNKIVFANGSDALNSNTYNKIPIEEHTKHPEIVEYISTENPITIKAGNLVTLKSGSNEIKSITPTTPITRTGADKTTTINNSTKNVTVTIELPTESTIKVLKPSPSNLETNLNFLNNHAEDISPFSTYMHTEKPVLSNATTEVNSLTSIDNTIAFTTIMNIPISNGIDNLTLFSSPNTSFKDAISHSTTPIAIINTNSNLGVDNVMEDNIIITTQLAFNSTTTEPSFVTWSNFIDPKQNLTLMGNESKWISVPIIANELSTTSNHLIQDLSTTKIMTNNWTDISLSSNIDLLPLEMEIMKEQDLLSISEYTTLPAESSSTEEIEQHIPLIDETELINSTTVRVLPNVTPTIETVTINTTSINEKISQLTTFLSTTITNLPPTISTLNANCCMSTMPPLTTSSIATFTSKPIASTLEPAIAVAAVNTLTTQSESDPNTFSAAAKPASEEDIQKVEEINDQRNPDFSSTMNNFSVMAVTAAPITMTTELPTSSVNMATSTLLSITTMLENTPTYTAPFSSLENIDYKQICGRRMFPEPRIVGGANAAFGRWPWQISLRQWRTSTYLHKCGAVLLNENWAITAAHCVDNVPPSDLLLRLGQYDLAEEEEPYGYQERRVQIVASHPQFDPRTFEYDLALLRFYEPVLFQPNIIPVCVPDSDENFIGQTAFVTGWGRLYDDGPLPSVLQEVAVPVINNTICEWMYRAAGYIEHIPHIFICAGWKKGGHDSCEGDSGGPMVLQRESDKRYQLGGVISWGIGCAESNQPGVYTRISEFRDWINQILQF